MLDSYLVLPFMDTNKLSDKELNTIHMILEKTPESLHADDGFDIVFDTGTTVSVLYDKLTLSICCHPQSRCRCVELQEGCKLKELVQLSDIFLTIWENYGLLK